MKKILNILGILFVIFSSAQTNLTSTENYIYSKTCLNDDCSKKSESVQYFDSWGKPIQVIDIKGSPTGKDVVGHIEYDAFGRKVKNYLPVPQAGTQNGLLYTSPLSNAPAVYGSEKIYSESILESSPLNKVLQQIQAGTDWSNKPVNLVYEANAAGDVSKFTTTTSWENGATKSILSNSGTYAAEKLSKNSVIDEDGNKTVEFKNAKGQVVLIRKFDGSSPVDTYYVYNEYNQLAFVLPPNAVNKPITDQLLNDLCYQYRYDGWNRQVEKKVPGKGWEYMVYDKADRLILTQDANMRLTNNWILNKYDKFGRVICTAMIAGLSRTAWQDLIKGMIITEYRHATGFTKNGMTFYYSNDYFFADIQSVLSINYYDTYPAYSFNPSMPAAIFGSQILTDNMTADLNTKGLPVMSLVKNIEDDNWTRSYIYYDTKGRAVGTYSVNHLGGYTKTESEFDFAGLAKQTKVYHKRLDTDTEKVITQTFSYDSQNRLLVHKHKVDSNPEEILAQNEYNELSQLKTKKVGGTNPSSPLQTIDYSYNIKGWLTKINDPTNLNGKLFGYEIKYNNPVYTNMAGGKYNGNIAEVDWKTSNDGMLRRYSYQYDALNRLANAAYSEPNSSVPQNNFFNESMSYDMNGNMVSLQRNTKSIASTAEQIDKLNYSYSGNRLSSVTDISANYKGYPDVSGNTIAYDDNGNMKDQKDKGILQIRYNYLNLPNYLEFDRQYFTRNIWQNENVYNFYRADGTKLRKEHRYSENSVYIKKTVDYLDGFQYEAIQSQNITVLKFVPTAEGYYNFENNKYIYSYTDHLGNVRVSYTNNGSGAAIIEENNYYPFGLKHEGYNTLTGNPAYTYGYNGKELQKETGWGDYGARMYMSDIGRWGVIDPLAEQMRRFSPYNYAFNNPVNFVDPDGRAPYNPRDVYGEHSAFNGDFDPNSSLSGYNGMGGSYANYFASDAGGGATTFGQTQAYRDLMDVYYSPGGTGGLTNIGGVLRWWTDYTDPDSGVTGVGQLNMLKLAGLSTFSIGVIGTGMEIRGALNSKSMYSQGVRQGLNGTSYVLTGRNARLFAKAQPTKATLPVSKIGKFGKGLGYGSFGAGILIDGYGAYEYSQNPSSSDAVHPVKAVTNTGIGAWGLWGGPYGIIVSTVYGAFEAFYDGGLNGYVEDGAKYQKELNGFNKAGPYNINLVGAHEPK